jgi:hypothetical protein
MKTRLALLILTLATAASAAPLSPTVSSAFGAGVSASNQTRLAPTLTAQVPAPTLRTTIPVPVTPRPTCVPVARPVPAQAFSR